MTSTRRQKSGTEGLTAGTEALLEPVLVEVIEGPDKGQRVELTERSLRVGSQAGLELVLTDSTVSRHHALLRPLPGAVLVQDTGSRNGTFYLKARVTEARVPVGGTVKLGRTVLRFARLDRVLPRSDREELHGMLGRSPRMQETFALLEKIGRSEANVLIHGETGVGKDLAARAIHALSSRARAPFVVFDCTAVKAELVESELFGHARGAFTSANRERQGALSSAGQGTLFLDEVGDLPLELQPRLLRALESREFKPVGDDRTRKFEARVVSATHRDLASEVAAGRFRSDLYFRLTATTVEIPPLRERPEDIPLLALAFAEKLCGFDLSLDEATLTALQCDPWPGNVRELKNAVERVVALEQGKGHASTPRADAKSRMRFNEARDQVLDSFERAYLTSLLRRNDGNISAAAREAGISRVRLYRLLKRQKLEGGLDEPSTD